MKANRNGELKALRGLKLINSVASKSFGKMPIRGGINTSEVKTNFADREKQQAGYQDKPIVESCVNLQCGSPEKTPKKLIAGKFRLLQVPLDGSIPAEHALPLAVSLAKRDGATLQVVRVNQPISSGIYLHRLDTRVVNLDRGLMDEHSDNLDPTVRRLKKTGIHSNSVQLDGPVPETIARHAATSGADLLIITTRGRGSLARFWFGSVADSLIRQSSIPILVLRPKEKARDFSSLSTVRHVLMPLDGSLLAEQALEPALKLVGTENGEFTLLRIVPVVIPAVYGPTTAPARGIHTSWHQELHKLKRKLWAEAHQYLERLAAPLRAKSLNVRTHVIAHDHPTTAILDAASSRGADVIAMTTRGQSGLKRLLLGSVADKVIRNATTPVLICPPVTVKADTALEKPCHP